MHHPRTSRIGTNERRPFVIAEIGVNHDGSVARAIELVGIAKRCGADAVKLQVFRATQLMNAAATFAEYQKSRVDAADPVAMLQKYELGFEELGAVTAAIVEAGLVPMATPFSIEDVGVIDRLGLSLVKIASPDLVNLPLLNAVARLGKPMVLSTGAATMDEVLEAVSWTRESGAAVSLLHCISSYPTPTEQTHLSWIRELAAATGLAVGYSDHSTEVISGALAVAAGATILERHLTYDKGAPGPDHSASSNPEEFAEYVRLSRLADAMVGSGSKRVLSIEQDVRVVSRQSLVAAVPLAAGTVLNESHLRVQRPGTGIPAKDVARVIGRSTACAIPAGRMIEWSMLV